MFLLLLLFLATLPSPTSANLVTFNITMLCNAPFYAKVKLVEEDFFESSNDVLHYELVQSVAPPGSKVHSKTLILRKFPYGDWSFFYEFFLRIVHTCAISYYICWQSEVKHVPTWDDRKVDFLVDLSGLGGGCPGDTDL